MTRKVQEILSAYWALSPIYYAVRIFGLAPYSVEVKNNRARWRVSNLSFLYSVLFFIIILLCLIPMINHTRRTILQGRQDKIAMYSELFRRASGLIICIVNLSLSMANRCKSCHLMKDLNSLDLDLMNRGIKVDFKNMRRENTILVVVFGLLLVASVVMHSAIVDLDEESVWYRSTNILLFVVYYLTVVQFISFVLALQRRWGIHKMQIVSIINNMTHCWKNAFWFLKYPCNFNQFCLQKKFCHKMSKNQCTDSKHLFNNNVI